MLPNKAQHTAHFVRWTRVSYAYTRLCGQRYVAIWMSLFLIITIGIAIAVTIYSAVSYYLLKHLGITESRLRRAIQFGSTLLAICIISQAIRIPLLGLCIAVGLSFVYIRHVLKVHWAFNLAIIFLLPLVTGIALLPLIKWYFYAAT